MVDPQKLLELRLKRIALRKREQHLALQVAHVQPGPRGQWVLRVHHAYRAAKYFRLETFGPEKGAGYSKKK